MTTYKNFKIKGFDVSQYNDNQETPYVPDFDKLITRGFKFVGIRTSYGIVKDKDFDRFWKQAGEKGLNRVPYPYLDYYSYKQLNISPAEWGRRQAQFVWSLLKDEPGEAWKLFKKYVKVITFLDVENSSIEAITEANKSVVGVIINAFFLEFDTLSSSTTGIYTNQGYLFVFGTSHKTRPLWFSWYNRAVTIERIQKVLADWSYTGELGILQYTSDGDIDDDGISDARAMGMESSSLDLDVWLGDPADLDVTISTTEPVQTVAPIEAMPVQTITIMAPLGLKVREGPAQSYGSDSALPVGTQRPVIQTQIDLAGNFWVEIAEGWICEKFGTQVLAEIS